MRIVLLLTCAAAAPPVPPATLPSKADAPRRPYLANGTFRYSPPQGWRLVRRGALAARFRSDDRRGQITITVTPQNSVPTLAHKRSMAITIGDAIRRNVKREGTELLLNPRVIEDERFFLKVQDRTRAESYGVADRLQIYRTMDLNLVHVAVVAFTDDPEEARKIHAVGETLLDEATIGRGPTPVVYGRARVKVTPPVDWTQRRADEPNGQVATFEPPPEEGEGRIELQAMVLPRDARVAGAAQSAAVAEMRERVRLLAARDADWVGKLTALPGGIETVAISYRAPDGVTRRTIWRIVQAGEVLVAVGSIVPEEAAVQADKRDEATPNPIESAADEVAESVKPARPR